MLLPLLGGARLLLLQALAVDDVVAAVAVADLAAVVAAVLDRPAPVMPLPCEHLFQPKSRQQSEQRL